jgi:arginase
MPTSVTIIFSPFHFGQYDVRVGGGPLRIQAHGVVRELEALGLPVHFHHIAQTDEDGDVMRQFKNLGLISEAVSAAQARDSFPLVLAGNCMSTVGVVAGLKTDEEPALLYFDAHDDYDTADSNSNGYFDAMGLTMLCGESWHNMIKTVPGHKPLKERDILFIGLRDQDEIQTKRIKDASFDVIYGSTTQKVDYAGELESRLKTKAKKPSIVHFDLDVLDESLGDVNGYSTPGGLFEDDVKKCFETTAKLALPMAMVVASYNPRMGGGDDIAKIAVRRIVGFAESMLANRILVKSSS